MAHQLGGRLDSDDPTVEHGVTADSGEARRPKNRPTPGTRWNSSAMRPCHPHPGMSAHGRQEYEQKKAGDELLS
ncbi:hypothetical protein NDU88_007724 [Pleurodeles waltl]|uniref:Uncharacterized protein n=1 Tax=Pleurodeles waltl TaxID=8319 RepID=A0AAV7VQI6_PLEWA|nr:hypothetical protein NDU88_007724 [Pleurodeles waltl]